MLKHGWIGLLENSYDFRSSNRVQGALNFLKELLITNHLLMWLDHGFPDPVFEVPPDEFNSVEVASTRGEEEHCHSEVPE